MTVLNGDNSIIPFEYLNIFNPLYNFAWILNDSDTVDARCIDLRIKENHVQDSAVVSALRSG